MAMTAACGAGRFPCCSCPPDWRLGRWFGSRTAVPTPPRGRLARFGARPLVAAMGRPRLSLIMSLLFIGLSIPILIFILIYNYSKNSAAIVSILNDAVTQTSHAGIERTQDLIQNTESPLR